MKYLILCIFFLYGYSSYSQFYFGGDKNSTKKQLIDTNRDIKILSEDSKQISYMLTERNTAGKILFSDDDKLIGQVIIPLSPETLNKWVSSLNKSCAIVSKNEWTNYIDGKSYTIKLAYQDGNYMISAYENKL